jgi:hypothetical protein
MERRLGITAGLALAGAVLLSVLAGCAAAPTPVATETSSTSAAAAASPAATSAASAPAAAGDAPILRPDLAASENLAYFDSVNVGVIAADASAGGRAFIDALVAAGFEESQMEVTADRTTVDLPADSVQFAVLFEGECLIGQYGPASGGYHSAVGPALGTGGCLVGETRPIDW